MPDLKLGYKPNWRHMPDKAEACWGENGTEDDMALHELKQTIEHWVSIDTLLQVVTYGSLLSVGIVYLFFM